MIPTFTAEGLRWRDSSSEAVERWLGEGRVIVQRNRRGEIVCAQFRFGNGASPVRRRAHMGQHYSYEQRIGRYRVWRHKRLPHPQQVEQLMGTSISAQEADLFVRAVFRTVALSILK